MSTITLSKTETKLLVEAAERGGTLEIPDATKPTTRQRLVGHFERDGLIVAGETGQVLTRAGYRAVGLRPPRQTRTASEGEAAGTGAGTSTPLPRGTKQALVLDLLGRSDGASIDELMGATGWLPHTTRAALSRLRSAGKPLAKSSRPDGRTAYRILVEEPVAPKPRKARIKQVEQLDAAAA